jgi:hypothetical protein
VRYAPKRKEEEREEKAKEEKEREDRKQKKGKKVESRPYEPIFGVMQRNCLMKRKQFRDERTKALSEIGKKQFSTQAEVMASLPGLDRKNLKIVKEEEEVEEEEEEVKREEGEVEENENGMFEKDDDVGNLISNGKDERKKVDGFLVKLLSKSAVADNVKVVNDEGNIESKENARGKRNFIFNKKYINYFT